MIELCRRVTIVRAQIHSMKRAVSSNDERGPSAVIGSTDRIKTVLGAPANARESSPMAATELDFPKCGPKSACAPKARQARQLG